MVKKRRWRLTQDGQKQLIEVDKRLKHWWKLQTDGKLLLTVRHSAKAIEFEKGKDTVVVAYMHELATVLPKLIGATDAGELDAHINAATKSNRRL